VTPPSEARLAHNLRGGSDSSVDRFMRAMPSIKHIRETFGRYSDSAPLRAAALLAILVIHLVYMASPLHGWTLTQRSHIVAMTSTEVGQATATVERAAHDEHAGHCLIQWTKAAEGMALASILAITSARPGVGLEQHLPLMLPVAQAHGPPLGDRQALLQVFRL
jgi:hypothetical protein